MTKTGPRRSTSLIHHAYQPPAGFAAVQPAVHKASTVLFADTAALRARDWKEKTGYTYGLHGTPTTFTLEERIATLEGGLQTLLVPSGLAAIALVDHGAAEERRRGAAARQRLRPEQGAARATSSPAGASRIASTTRWIRRRSPRRSATATRLVWLEAPGSVTMEFPDLRGAASRVRARARRDDRARQHLGRRPRVRSVRSARRSAPVAVDISVQALTKYPSGGGDVLMGSVTTRDEALHQRLKGAHMRLGFGVGANDAELVLRSLPSLRAALRGAGPRRRARSRAGGRGGPRSSQVLHPALEGSPGHEHWARAVQRRGRAVLGRLRRALSRAAQVDAFVDALRLFRIGYSWAGPVSLVVPYDLAAMRGAAALAPARWCASRSGSRTSTT